jgi:hypothetical protein
MKANVEIPCSFGGAAQAIPCVPSSRVALCVVLAYSKAVVIAGGTPIDDVEAFEKEGVTDLWSHPAVDLQGFLIAL